MGRAPEGFTCLGSALFSAFSLLSHLAVFNNVYLFRPSLTAFEMPLEEAQLKGETEAECDSA